MASYAGYGPIQRVAYRVRDLVGWAEEFLLRQDDDLDPELDDVSNQLLLEISDTIRAECERILRR